MVSRFHKSHSIRLLIAAVCTSLGACSGMINSEHQNDQPSPPNAQLAFPNIKKVAAQYHLTGQLEFAGPFEAPITSPAPWEICLKGASDTRFSVALLYKGDTFNSAREATMGDHCDHQNYQIIPD